jgi:hypothetical protein
MQARFIVLVALVALAAVALAPDLLVQIFIRGGFVIGGIAITLALRPRDEDTAEVAVPVARAVGHH